MPSSESSCFGTGCTYLGRDDPDRGIFKDEAIGCDGVGMLGDDDRVGSGVAASAFDVDGKISPRSKVAAMGREATRRATEFVAGEGSGV